MKNKLILPVLAVVVALATGYFIGARLGTTKIPTDIVNSFENCTRQCDELEDSVNTRHRACRDAYHEESEQTYAFCRRTHWGEECQERLGDLSQQLNVCESAYETGTNSVRDCRIRCNNLISIKE